MGEGTETMLTPCFVSLRGRNIQLHSKRGKGERGSKLAIYSELGERQRLHVRATSVDSNYGAVSSIICCIDYGARSGTMEYVRWSTELLLADGARLMTPINEITRLNGKEDEWRRHARAPH